MQRIVGLMIVGIAFMCYACNSDEEMDAYSGRGAESDKDILLASSDGLYNEIEKLGLTDFALVSHSMHNRIGDIELQGNGRFVQALIGLGQLMYEAESSDCYFDELMEMTFDKEYYCNILHNEGFGIWQWDVLQKRFVKIGEHESEVTFIFPATDSDNGEVAVLSVTELVVYEGLFPGKGEMLDDGTVIDNALETLRFNLKIDDELILTSNVLSAFNADGYYNDVAMTFNPTPYNLRGELAKEDDKGYWMFGFKRENEVILDHGLILLLDKSNELMPVEQIDNALLINDVVIETSAQTGKLYNELLEVDKFEEGSEMYALSLASALNSHGNIDVRYIHDNSIIAKVDAVVKFDAANSTWWVDLEFEFSDGSRISGEEFFEDYLTNFKVELEQIVSEFEYKFGV